MSEAIVRRLHYRADSAHLMTRLQEFEGAVFLDSGGSESPGARYDILSALPGMTLSLERGRVRARGCKAYAAGLSGGTDLFEAVKKALGAYSDHASSVDATVEDLARLPFKGGAIGYFGYASSDSCRATAPDTAPAPSTGQEEDGATAVPTAQIGIYLWAIIVDHHNRETVFFALPACENSTLKKVTAMLDEIESRTQAGSGPDQAGGTEAFQLLEPFQSNFSVDSYGRAFDRVKQHIDSGDCYQVNLAQRFSSRYSGRPFTAYLHLRKASNAPFSAYIGLPPNAKNDRPGSCAVLCLSPERFLEIAPETGTPDRPGISRRLRVLTQPIKGTRPRGSTPEQDREFADELRASSKDRAENLMIVDLLRNDLGTLCQTGSVRTEKLFELQSFNGVHHLVSTVSGMLEALPAPADATLNLLRRCFPGGSITGAPKIKAREIIRNLEPDARSVYCGSVCYVGFDGQMDSNIMIRTLLLDRPNIHCWAGGGIVSDSVQAQEYQECQDKITVIIKALQSIAKED